MRLPTAHPSTADSVADASGPLRVIATTLRKKGTYLFKVHLLDNQSKTIGCGWSPNLARVNELTSDEYIANIDAHLCCERCFKHHTFPADWQTPSATNAPLPTEASSASSPDSEDSLTDDSVDTASEAEKVTSEMIHRSHEHAVESEVHWF